MQTYYDKIKATNQESAKTWHDQVCDADLEQLAEIQQNERAWETWTE